MTQTVTQPSTPDRDVLRNALERAGKRPWIGRALSAPLRKLWLNVTRFGRENVPSAGPVILAANHLAFIDSPLVMYGLDRPVAFLGKSEYLDHPIARRLFPMSGMLPLDRTGRRSLPTLRRVNEILKQGGAIGVHPEGTRSRDGALAEGHSGVAQMALRAGAPIVPVGIVGTGRAQPVGRTIPAFRGKVEIHYGSPIGVGEWAQRRSSRTARQELTEQVMTEIAALSGQDRRTEPLPMQTQPQQLSVS